MKKGYLYIVLSAILFNTMEIALKVVADDFNPVQMTFLRFLIGAVILMPLAVRGLLARKCHLKIGDFAFFAWTGFICVVVSMVLYQMAILYSQASIVAVLMSCIPVFSILFAFLLLHEKIYKHTVFSLIISMIGIIIFMNPLRMSGSPIGYILTILSAATFALYGIISLKRSVRYGGIALTCFSFLFGSMEMFLLILISRMASVSAILTREGLTTFANIPILQGINGHTCLNLIYIGIFVTGLGYTFYFLAMETTSAATASLVFYIKPALAPVLAFIIIHEPLTLNMMFGILFLLIGSLISFIPDFKAQKRERMKTYQKVIHK